MIDLMSLKNDGKLEAIQERSRNAMRAKMY